MEPFRPVVDWLVTRLPKTTDTALDAERRAKLSACLTYRIAHDGESRTVSDWLFRTAASLSAVYLDQRKDLLLPSGLEHGESYT